MSSQVPLESVDDEEQDEITLKYRRLLPNYFLAASPQLSALHFRSLRSSETTLNSLTENTRCPRCGHFFASTRVSVLGNSSKGLNLEEVKETTPSSVAGHGASIARTCIACHRRTVLRADQTKSKDGRKVLIHVRARAKGQRPQPPTLNSVPSTFVAEEEQTLKKKTRQSRRPEVETSKPSKPHADKPPKPTKFTHTGISKKKAKGLEGLLLKSRAEQDAKAKQSTSNLADFLQSL